MGKNARKPLTAKNPRVEPAPMGDRKRSASAEVNNAQENKENLAALPQLSGNSKRKVSGRGRQSSPQPRISSNTSSAPSEYSQQDEQSYLDLSTVVQPGSSEADAGNSTVDVSDVWGDATPKQVSIPLPQESSDDTAPKSPETHADEHESHDGPVQAAADTDEPKPREPEASPEKDTTADALAQLNTETTSHSLVRDRSRELLAHAQAEVDQNSSRIVENDIEESSNMPESSLHASPPHESPLREPTPLPSSSDFATGEEERDEEAEAVKKVTWARTEQVVEFDVPSDANRTLDFDSSLDIPRPANPTRHSTMSMPRSSSEMDLSSPSFQDARAPLWSEDPEPASRDDSVLIHDASLSDYAYNNSSIIVHGDPSYDDSTTDDLVKELDDAVKPLAWKHRSDDYDATLVGPEKPLHVLNSTNAAPQAKGSPRPLPKAPIPSTAPNIDRPATAQSNYFTPEPDFGSPDSTFTDVFRTPALLFHDQQAPSPLSPPSAEAELSPRHNYETALRTRHVPASGSAPDLLESLPSFRPVSPLIEDLPRFTPREEYQSEVHPYIRRKPATEPGQPLESAKQPQISQDQQRPSCEPEREKEVPTKKPVEVPAKKAIAPPTNDTAPPSDPLPAPPQLGNPEQQHLQALGDSIRMSTAQHQVGHISSPHHRIESFQGDMGEISPPDHDKQRKLEAALERLRTAGQPKVDPSPPVESPPSPVPRPPTPPPKDVPSSRQSVVSIPSEETAARRESILRDLIAPKGADKKSPSLHETSSSDNPSATVAKEPFPRLVSNSSQAQSSDEPASQGSLPAKGRQVDELTPSRSTLEAHPPLLRKRSKSFDTGVAAALTAAALSSAGRSPTLAEQENMRKPSLGFAAGMEKSLDAIFADKPSYRLRHSKTVFARDASSQFLRSTAPPESDLLPTWTRIRSLDDIDAALAPAIAQCSELHRAGALQGKLFLTIRDAAFPGLPIPSRPTYFFCELDNGKQQVHTQPFVLASSIDIQQEFELICHRSLAFDISYKVDLSSPRVNTHLSRVASVDAESVADPHSRVSSSSMTEGASVSNQHSPDKTITPHDQGQLQAEQRTSPQAPVVAPPAAALAPPAEITSSSRSTSTVSSRHDHAHSNNPFKTTKVTNSPMSHASRELTHELDDVFGLGATPRLHVDTPKTVRPQPRLHEAPQASHSARVPTPSGRRSAHSQSRSSIFSRRSNLKSLLSSKMHKVEDKVDSLFHTRRSTSRRPFSAFDLSAYDEHKVNSLKEVENDDFVLLSNADDEPSTPTPNVPSEAASVVDHGDPNAALQKLDPRALFESGPTSDSQALAEAQEAATETPVAESATSPPTPQPAPPSEHESSKAPTSEKNVAKEEPQSPAPAPAPPADPLVEYLAEDGTFAFVNIVFANIAEMCRAKPCFLRLPWRHRAAEPPASQSEALPGVSLLLFFLPRIPGVAASELPQSYDECQRGLDEAKWHATPTHSGALTQMGGDCSIWRRRYFSLIGKHLVAFHETSRTPTLAIPLHSAAVIDNNNISAKADADDYNASVWVAPRSFRISLPGDDQIHLFADSDVDKTAWLAALSTAIAHPQPQAPRWARILHAAIHE